VNSEPFLGPLWRAAGGAGSASLTTVLVAFAANLSIAQAKDLRQTLDSVRSSACGR